MCTDYFIVAQDERKIGMKISYKYSLHCFLDITTSWKAPSIFCGGSLALVSMYGKFNRLAIARPSLSLILRKCTRSTLLATNKIGYSSLKN
jgi:hypothetical protein